MNSRPDMGVSMDSGDYRAFHLVRAKAEHIAADKATTVITRDLHNQLAELHGERALLYGAEEVWAAAPAQYLRQTALVAAPILS